MKVVVGGSSGLIGAALVRRLQSDGHDVLRLVRRAPTAPDEAEWDPVGGSIDAGALAGVREEPEGECGDVHLALAQRGDVNGGDPGHPRRGGRFARSVCLGLRTRRG